MGSIAERADRLASRALSIADAQLRVAYVRHQLLCMSPVDAADLAMVIITGAEARRPGYVELMLSLALSFADPAADGLRGAMVRSAGARGHTEVVRVFQRREEEGGADHRVPDFGKGRPLTLGERKTLARRNDRLLIGRVLGDPHPDVIRILLHNPSLTEQDVIRLCARRPVAPAVLREVFRSPKWVVRYRVRRTLVLNPNTPLDVAMQLSGMLTAQDARLVSSSEELSDELRQACRRTARSSTVH